MALVHMSHMLQKSRDRNYAVGAFNILDYNSFKAVVSAADELDAPVSWTEGGDISALAGKPVRLRFALKDADVFALRTGDA